MSQQIEHLKKRIGSRLKEFRKGAGLTQSDLANKLNRSPEGISNIERGSSLPPLDTLCVIADVLNVTVFDFFEGSEEQQIGKREEAEAAIRAELRQLNDDEIDTALRLVVALREDK